MPNRDEERIQLKLAKFEEIVEIAQTITEDTQGFLSVQEVFRITSGDNFELLVDAHLTNCTDKLADMLKVIGRNTDPILNKKNKGE